MNFGEYVRIRRREMGMPSKLLSRAMQVSCPFLSAIELRNKVPSVEVIVKIADALNIDRKELLMLAMENRIESYKKILDKKWSRYFL